VGRFGVAREVEWEVDGLDCISPIRWEMCTVGVREVRDSSTGARDVGLDETGGDQGCWAGGVPVGGPEKNLEPQILAPHVFVPESPRREERRSGSCEEENQQDGVVEPRRRTIQKRQRAAFSAIVVESSGEDIEDFLTPEKESITQSPSGIAPRKLRRTISDSTTPCDARHSLGSLDCAPKPLSPILPLSNGESLQSPTGEYHLRNDTLTPAISDATSDAATVPPSLIDQSSKEFATFGREMVLPEGSAMPLADDARGNVGILNPTSPIGQRQHLFMNSPSSDATIPPTEYDVRGEPNALVLNEVSICPSSDILRSSSRGDAERNGQVTVDDGPVSRIGYPARHRFLVSPTPDGRDISHTDSQEEALDASCIALERSTKVRGSSSDDYCGAGLIPRLSRDMRGSINLELSDGQFQHLHVGSSQVLETNEKLNSEENSNMDDIFVEVTGIVLKSPLPDDSMCSPALVTGTPGVNCQSPQFVSATPVFCQLDSIGEQDNVREASGQGAEGEDSSLNPNALDRIPALQRLQELSPNLRSPDGVPETLLSYEKEDSERQSLEEGLDFIVKDTTSSFQQGEGDLKPVSDYTWVHQSSDGKNGAYPGRESEDSRRTEVKHASETPSAGVDLTENGICPNTPIQLSAVNPECADRTQGSSTRDTNLLDKEEIPMNKVDKSGSTTFGPTIERMRMNYASATQYEDSKPIDLVRRRLRHDVPKIPTLVLQVQNEKVEEADAEIRLRNAEGHSDVVRDDIPTIDPLEHPIEDDLLEVAVSLFTTGRGKKMTLSKEAFHRAKGLAEQVHRQFAAAKISESDTNLQRTGEVIGTFDRRKWAGGAEKPLLESTRPISDPRSEEPIHQRALKIRPSVSLFTTGNGNAVHISRAALAKGKSLIDATGGAGRNDLEGKVELWGKNAISGVASEVGGATLPRDGLREPERVTAIGAPQKPENDIGSIFMTGTGRTIKVSETSLAKGKILLSKNDVRPENTEANNVPMVEETTAPGDGLSTNVTAGIAPPPSINNTRFLFTTGAGKKLKISEASLGKGKLIFSQSEERLKSADGKNSVEGSRTCGSLFSTGNGKVVKISDKALAKARLAIGDEERCEANADGVEYQTEIFRRSGMGDTYRKTAGVSGDINIGYNPRVDDENQAIERAGRATTNDMAPVLERARKLLHGHANLLEATSGHVNKVDGDAVQIQSDERQVSERLLKARYGNAGLQGHCEDLGKENNDGLESIIQRARLALRDKKGSSPLRGGIGNGDSSMRTPLTKKKSGFPLALASTPSSRGTAFKKPRKLKQPTRSSDVSPVPYKGRAGTIDLGTYLIPLNPLSSLRADENGAMLVARISLQDVERRLGRRRSTLTPDLTKELSYPLSDMNGSRDFIFSRIRYGEGDPRSSLCQLFPSVFDTQDCSTYGVLENFGLAEFRDLVSRIFPNQHGPMVATRVGSERWADVVYELAVWKLAALEAAFPLTRRLTLTNLFRTLAQRIDREWNRASVPPLLRIIRRDAMPGATCVLVVRSVTRSAQILVSDGWYIAPAELDEGLQRLVQLRKLSVGDKIVICGASVRELPNTPQDDELASRSLALHLNGVRKARWCARLGFRKRPLTLICLKSAGSGGCVASCLVIIQRVYPIKYAETLPSDQGERRNRIFLSEEGERRAQEHWVRQMEELHCVVQESKEDDDCQARGTAFCAREVSPLMEVKVSDVHGHSEGVISLWRPNYNQRRMLSVEGSCVQLFNVQVAQEGDELKLSLSSRSTICEHHPKQNPAFAPRIVKRIGALPALKSGSFFDAPLIPVLLGSLQEGGRSSRRFVYFCDSNAGRMLAVSLHDGEADHPPRILQEFYKGVQLKSTSPTVTVPPLVFATDLRFSHIDPAYQLINAIATLRVRWMTASEAMVRIPYCKKDCEKLELRVGIDAWSRYHQRARRIDTGS